MRFLDYAAVEQRVAHVSAPPCGFLRVREPGTNEDMCRSIKPLFNFDPPVTEAEVRAAALQFVRKISGARKPSAANVEPFDLAVDEITASASRLLQSLVTTSPPKDRDVEAAKARERFLRRAAQQ